MNKFYFIGKYAFLVIGIMGLTNLLNEIITRSPDLTAWGLLGGIANIIFNFALMGFFAWLLKQNKQGMPSKQEIDDMILGVMKDGDKLKQKNIPPKV